MPDSKLAIITPVGEGAHIDNDLPQWPPANGGNPPYPDHGLPDGGNVGTPEHPIVLPPSPPPYPSVGLPPVIWPGVPVHLPAPGEPPITLPPGAVYPPLPPVIDTERRLLVLVWIPRVGYRWVVLGGQGQPVPTPV
jgi:hypothetical protein